MEQVRALGRNAAKAVVSRHLVNGDCLFVVPIAALLASDEWSFGIDILDEEATHITVGWASHDTTFDVNHGVFLLPQWVAAETGGSATVVPSGGGSVSSPSASLSPAVTLKPGDFIECRASRSRGEFTFYLNGALVLAVRHTALSSLQIPLWPAVDARGGTFRFRFNESVLLGHLARNSETGQGLSQRDNTVFAGLEMQSQSDFLRISPAADFSFDSGDMLDKLRAQQMLHDTGGPIAPDLFLDMSVNAEARVELSEASVPVGA